MQSGKSDTKQRCTCFAKHLAVVHVTLHPQKSSMNTSKKITLLAAKQPLSLSAQISGARAKARAPEQMPADITLRDLSAWRRSWDDFAELEQLDRLPVSQQRAMLRTNLTVEMRAVLQLAIGIDTDDASSVSEIVDAIQGYVRSKRNVTLDRVALEERRQEEGETFDEYYIALREIANNADLCKVCVDDRLTTRIMAGIRDPEIRRKLLAHTPPPSLQTTINICRREESARNDEIGLVKSENVSIKWNFFSQT